MTRFKLATVPSLVAGGADGDDPAAPGFGMGMGMSLKAVIAELKFLNRHSYVYFDAADKSEETVSMVMRRRASRHTVYKAARGAVRGLRLVRQARDTCRIANR